jgi:hypothetical protein
MMRDKLLSILLILWIVSGNCGCQNSEPEPPKTTLSGPVLAGSKVYVLTGNAINTQEVSINNLSLDFSSVSAISDSVNAIFASTYEDGVLITADTARRPDFTIDFSAPGTRVSDIYYGVNIQIVSKQYLSNPIYRELARNLKIDITRFPGGQERVEYVKNPPAGFVLDPGYQYLLTGEDVENYINFCSGLGIKAELEFNLTNNDPQMWKSMTEQIVNDLGYNLEYMSSGNEPDINPTGNWTYLQATSREAALDSYMSRYLAYAAEIRNVKPGMTFIVGETSGVTAPELDNIFSRIIPQSTSVPPGAFSFHWYILGDYGQPNYYPNYPSIDHMVVSGNDGHNIRNLSEMCTSARKYIPTSAKLVVGEWSSSWSATPGGVDTERTLATAIFAAEVMEYGKVLGIDSMQYFGLSDPADFYPWCTSLIIENNGSFSVRPQYYVWMMYKYIWGSMMIPVPQGQQDQFSIYASKDGTNNYIMLINRTANKSFQKTLKLITNTHPDGTSVDILVLPKSVTVIKLPSDI